MKTVYFVRHAKSSWEDHTLRDKDRPLNKRGKRDAPFMANLMKEKGVQPDLIISSPANRAYTTACHFAAAFGIEAVDIQKEENIYEAYETAVLTIIQSLANSHQTIFVFGHNPSFTSLANLFTTNYIDNVPTCGIVQVAAAIEDWKNFGADTGKLVAFHYPKQYF